MTPSSLIIVVVAVDGANTKDFFLIDRAKLLLPLLVNVDCHPPPTTFVLLLLIVVPTRLFIEVDDNDVDLHVCICC